MAKLHIAQEILDILYPIGSVYMSTNNTKPANLFGGTWEQISGRFLYATTTSKTTGGASSVSYTPSGSIGNHTLTLDEIPAHTHAIPYQDGQRNADAGSDWQRQGWNLGQITKATGSAGGGKAHNHGFTGTKATINTMPPWFSVYCWYRTA